MNSPQQGLASVEISFGVCPLWSYLDHTLMWSKFLVVLGLGVLGKVYQSIPVIGPGKPVWSYKMIMQFVPKCIRKGPSQAPKPVSLSPKSSGRSVKIPKLSKVYLHLLAVYDGFEATHQQSQVTPKTTATCHGLMDLCGRLVPRDLSGWGQQCSSAPHQLGNGGSGLECTGNMALLKSLNFSQSFPRSAGIFCTEELEWQYWEAQAQLGGTTRNQESEANSSLLMGLVSLPCGIRTLLLRLFGIVCRPLELTGSSAGEGGTWKAVVRPGGSWASMIMRLDSPACNWWRGLHTLSLILLEVALKSPSRESMP